jgi:hypothetical protein
MRVTVLGRLWNFRFAHNLSNDGDCDQPDTKNKEIRVAASLDGERRLEVIIHEVTHAACWPFHEEFVEPFARDMARILSRLGYKAGEE